MWLHVPWEVAMNVLTLTLSDLPPFHQHEIGAGSGSGSELVQLAGIPTIRYYNNNYY